MDEVGLDYRVLDDKKRRLLNHFFERVVVDGERIIRFDDTEIARLILGHQRPQGPEPTTDGPASGPCFRT